LCRQRQTDFFADAPSSPQAPSDEWGKVIELALGDEVGTIATAATIL
jgi:hypothetical protein